MTQQDIVIWGFSLVNASVVYLMLRYMPVYSSRTKESEEDIAQRVTW